MSEERHALLDGVAGLTPGVLFLERTRTLVAADLHLGYEEVVGGALPLWSTTEQLGVLARVAHSLRANEVILLGDVLHGARMSAQAARCIRNGLAELAETGCAVVAVAGNHEGRTRGAEVLGETVESVVRDGWHLLHGDRPLARKGRAIIGHLHPSLRLGGSRSAPVFLYSEQLIVLPAMTPYSPGLSVLGAPCSRALSAWVERPGTLRVAAISGDRIIAFRTLAALRAAIGPRRK
ncbi:metallophosphoesterase [bacterium]|nr:MAG: metallophosphoesterase [bacterium]